MLRANSCIPAVAGILTAESFHDDAHRTIFQAVVELHRDYQKNQNEQNGQGDKAVDTVTLAEYLRDRERINDVGGYEYLGGLWDAAPSAVNYERYARIVQDRAALRDLIHILTELMRDALYPCMPTSDLLAAVRAKILEVTDDRTLPDPSTAVPADDH
jgi:replicative DNA helicase